MMTRTVWRWQDIPERLEAYALIPQFCIGAVGLLQRDAMSTNVHLRYICMSSCATMTELWKQARECDAAVRQDFEKKPYKVSKMFLFFVRNIDLFVLMCESWCELWPVGVRLAGT